MYRLRRIGVKQRKYRTRQQYRTPTIAIGTQKTVGNHASKHDFFAKGRQYRHGQ